MSGPVIVGVGQANYAGQQFVCATRIRNVSHLIFRTRRSSYIAFSSPCGLVTKRFRRVVFACSRIDNVWTHDSE
jgi:hypothetical protein